jgi:hypothetical protein
MEMMSLAGVVDVVRFVLLLAYFFPFWWAASWRVGWLG